MRNTMQAQAIMQALELFFDLSGADGLFAIDHDLEALQIVTANQSSRSLNRCHCVISK